MVLVKNEFFDCNRKYHPKLQVGLYTVVTHKTNSKVNVKNSRSLSVVTAVPAVMTKIDDFQSSAD